MEKASKNTKKEQKKIKPKKRLGQNFLTEAAIIDKLVAAAQIEPGQTILEIGPGTGNLTERLLETGNKVLAIEKDPEMITALETRFSNKVNFELRRGDILKFDEAKIAAPYKVAANLPFYLTGALIRKFLESKNPPLSLTVIVQKEVAQRVCAKPPKMNLLAVSTQFYAKPDIISYVSKGCFWPVPKVDCAILKLTLFAKEGERSDKEFARRFFGLVKAGFSHPRKKITGNLSAGLEADKKTVSEWLELNNVDPGARAETLSLKGWQKLTKKLPEQIKKSVKTKPEDS